MLFVPVVESRAFAPIAVFPEPLRFWDSAEMPMATF